MFANTEKIIMIDDDPIHTLVSELSIKKMYPQASFEMLTFNDAKKGLEYLLSLTPGSARIILFLDINMPVVNGWNVLTVLNDLQPAVKATISVYMLSSSLSAQDREKALSYPMVKDYLKKPFFTHFPRIFNTEIMNTNTDLLPVHKHLLQ